MAGEKGEGLRTRRVEDAAKGAVIRYGREKYLVMDKQRACIVRPAQYPVLSRKYAESYLLKLKNVQTGEERKIVVHKNGSVDEVEFDVKHGPRRARKKK